MTTNNQSKAETCAFPDCGRRANSVEHMDCSNRTAGAHAPKLNCHPFVAASKPEQTCQRAVIPTDQSYLGGAVVIVAAACGNPLPCADHPVVQHSPLDDGPHNPRPIGEDEEWCDRCQGRCSAPARVTEGSEPSSALRMLELIAKAVHSERSDASARHIVRELLNEPTMAHLRAERTPVQPSEDEDERKAFQRVWDRIRDREFGSGSVGASMAGIVREIWAERGAWERSKRR